MRAAAHPNPFLRAFAWFTAAATLLLICSGGMVTSKGAGLAVPDWPTTFGYNMFFFPFSKWVGGIFFEHTHRLIASTVGFLTVILAIWLTLCDVPRWLKRLGWVSLGAVVLQGVLGGLRVTLMAAQIGVFHACLAQAFFALLVLIALALSPPWQRLRELVVRQNYRSLARGAIFISLIIYGQLALGAAMRHQHRDLSISDFPLAYGQIIPRTDPATLARINEARERLALSEVTASQIWLQMAHRFGALVIGISIFVFWLFVRRNHRGAPLLESLSTFWLLLVLIQIFLGGWTILSNKAADIATMHVAVGAITFVTGVAISAIALRLQHLTRASLPVLAPVDPAEAGVI
ncbi:MAG TPA: COX15/CtaA family protein [Chthoniobacteraceae bacterium]|nr:COX15/CtaA family protein [Chthoniobacteraceae bacterium]